MRGTPERGKAPYDDVLCLTIATAWYRLFHPAPAGRTARPGSVWRNV